MSHSIISIVIKNVHYDLKLTVEPLKSFSFVDSLSILPLFLVSFRELY